MASSSSFLYGPVSIYRSPSPSFFLSCLSFSFSFFFLIVTITIFSLPRNPILVIHSIKTQQKKCKSGAVILKRSVVHYLCLFEIVFFSCSHSLTYTHILSLSLYPLISFLSYNLLCRMCGAPCKEEQSMVLLSTAAFDRSSSVLRKGACDMFLFAGTFRL